MWGTVIVVSAVWVSLGAATFMGALDRRALDSAIISNKLRWLLLIVLCGPVAWLMCLILISYALSDRIAKWANDVGKDTWRK
jgi:hypothetical protein